jgi:hypothetical protein
VGQTTPAPPRSCNYEDNNKLHGEVFAASDGCSECWCADAEVYCQVIPRKRLNTYFIGRDSIEKQSRLL